MDRTPGGHSHPARLRLEQEHLDIAERGDLVLDEGRLLEPLFDTDDMKEQKIAALCAFESVLIAARMTSQPIDWAFSTRIWTGDVKRRTDRPWRMLAKAVHGHGITVVTIDRASSRLEIACQVLLKAY